MNPDDPNDARRANMRLDHINGDLTELKTSMKEQKDLILTTCLEMASLKTEVRIVGGLVLAAVTTLIILYINHLAS